MPLFKPTKVLVVLELAVSCILAEPEALLTVRTDLGDELISLIDTLEILIPVAPDPGVLGVNTNPLVLEAVITLE